jgi:hypothetical protein
MSAYVCPFSSGREAFFKLSCMIREEREGKIPFVWLGMANTWVFPALKEEREKVMQPKRTRECVRTDAFLMHI